MKASVLVQDPGIEGRSMLLSTMAAVQHALGEVTADC